MNDELKLTPAEVKFIDAFNSMSREVNAHAVEKGFWKDAEKRNDYEMLMLATTEIAECVEGLRHGNPPDNHLPDFSSAEVEIADCIIRLMDQGYARGWRIADALVAKANFNKTRPHMHGKKA